MASTREKDQKKMVKRSSRLVQQGYRQQPLQIGDGQDEMDTFCEICHGHQWALSPWSNREGGRGERERVKLAVSLQHCTSYVIVHWVYIGQI